MNTKQEEQAIALFEKWANDNIASLDFSRTRYSARVYSSTMTSLIWLAWKAQSEKILELESKVHSSRYILEELNESGQKGVDKMSNTTGLPQGVIKAAFDNIFQD